MPLQAANLSFAYPKGPTVLDQLDCTINPGSITAIIGPNGAGKSTLLRTLAGLITPNSGGVIIDDSPLESLSASARARRLAYIAQRSSLAFDFNARMVVSFGRLTLPKNPNAVQRAIERFGLGSIADQPMGSLSVGQQQRVSLARAWSQLDNEGPPNSTSSGYLLADEPTSAMDPKHQIQTMDAFQELASRGIGVALVLHDLTLAARYADQAILLTPSGSIAAQGAIDEVLNLDQLAQVFETQFISADIQGQRIVLPHALAPNSDILEHE